MTDRTGLLKIGFPEKIRNVSLYGLGVRGYVIVSTRDCFKIFRVPDIPVDELYAGLFQPCKIQLGTSSF
jgi:hypothetical protein